MTSLTPLTDKELAAALHELAAGERGSTLEILVHLSEFERRDLHLRLGYPSMFEYCTRGLGYSESSAVRRLQSARLARRFPEVYRAIERKDLTVVTASMLSPVITRDNVNGLIAAARGKLQREVKGIVAALRPATMVIPDRVIPLSVPAPAPEVLSMLAPDAGGSAGPDRQDSYRHNGGKNPSTLEGAAAGPDTARDGSGPGSPSGGAHWGGPPGGAHWGGSSGGAQSGGPPGGAHWGGPPVGAHSADSPSGTHPVGPPPTEKRFKFEFGAGKDFMKKFSRVQSLISNKIPVRMTFEVLFECLMDEYLDRHDPEKRAQRRENRRAKAGTSRPSSTAGASQPGESAGEAQSGTTPGASQTGSTARAPQPGTTIGDSRPEANPRSVRHIPAAVRDSVYTRDSGRCTFTGPNGVRCETTRNLQIDHVKPFALGGGNDASNLRLLCAKHNQLQAKRTFGVTHTPAHHCRE